MQKLSIFVLILGISFLFSCQSQKELENSQVKLETELDEFSYSVGVSIGEGLKTQGIDSLNYLAMAEAVRHVMEEEDLFINSEEAMGKIQAYMQKGQESRGSASKEKGKAFLRENAKNPEVTELPSGLQYKILEEGEGPKPSANSTVLTHYHGTLIDGTTFDSSVERGEPAQFRVNQVIAGWTEALQLMPVGSKWRLFIPSDLAYGERGAGGAIGPNETLIFEVELIDIID
jgi:FKBP-type peptidyl-prolyl cis-trans isomerase FklB